MITVRRGQWAALLIVACIACVAVPDASSQYNASVQVMSTYDDNSFSFRDKRADVYHQTFGAFSRDFSGEFSFHQAFYYGAIVLFRTYGARTYHQHMLGFYSSYQLDYRGGDEEEDEEDNEEENTEDEENGGEGGEADGDSDAGNDESVEVDIDSSSHDTEADSTDRPDQPMRTTRGTPAPRPAASIAAEAEVFSDSLVTYLITKPWLSARFDKKDYQFYDFQLGALSLTLRRHLAGPLMGRLQYDGAFKDYVHFRQFTHFENIGTATISARVASPTEIFGAVSFGYKSYTETVDDTVFLETGGGNGKGKGGVKPKKTIISRYSTPATSQLTLAAGIVHTAWKDASVTLSYLRRINPSNEARYLDPRGIIGASEDDVFEDRYGYQGDDVSLILEAGLSTRSRITVETSVERRNFPRTATDMSGEALPGSPQRNDIRYVFGVLCMTTVLRSGDGGSALGLGAGYRFLRSQSNDEYHDYNTHQAMIVLEASL